MKNTLLACLTGIAIVVAIGCSSQALQDIRSDVDAAKIELDNGNLLLQQIDEVLDDPALVGTPLWEKAKAAKPRVEEKIDQMTVALEALAVNLEAIEASEGDPVGNGLQVVSAFATSLAPLLGPYGAVTLAVGGVAGAVGRSVGRKKGVDETLEVFENADVPVNVTKDLDNQQEILRKGNKAVAQGVGRLVTKQGQG